MFKITHFPLSIFQFPVCSIFIILYTKSMKYFFFCRNINSFNSGVTNCDLSDFEPRELDPVRHLVIDRDADIFESIFEYVNYINVLELKINFLFRKCSRTKLP